MKKLFVPVLIVFVLASAFWADAATLSLNGLFRDGMVLQRDAIVPVWGQCAPDTSVSVSFAGQTVRAQSDAEGAWQVRLSALKAGGPHRLNVTAGDETLQVEHVLVGDVWLCSGQSNMAFPVKSFANASVWLKDADYSEIRFFTVRPRKIGAIDWKVCNATTANQFSALGFLFGRELQRTIKVPIGLIDASISGSIIQKWMPIGGPTHGDLYRAMIQPLQPFAIKGAIWYQGESNGMFAQGEPYRYMLREMITDWRKHWGQGDFPFLIVQLPNFQSNSTWPELRESQAVAATLPHTGYVVTIDVGDEENIHPNDKEPVARRLALLARHMAYGDNIVYAGPTYRSMLMTDDGKIKIEFDHIGGGLVARDGTALRHFTIASENERFVLAHAQITGTSVTVWNDQVTAPVAVRYAWKDNPEHCNFYNQEGLPAAPFRTDDWRLRTTSKEKQ